MRYRETVGIAGNRILGEKTVPDFYDSRNDPLVPRPRESQPASLGRPLSSFRWFNPCDKLSLNLSEELRALP
jgi:hypothetical protein